VPQTSSEFKDTLFKMGSGVSTQLDGDLDAFKANLEQAWQHDGGAQQETIIRMVAEAQRFVREKKREMSQGVIPFPMENEELEKLWKLCDYNNNGFTALAEVDKMIVENYPQFDYKPAIMRAYHAVDRNKNGFITKREFKNFFGYLDYFCKLWEKFEGIDDNGDRRIDFEEMKRHSREIFGRELSDESATILFHSLDRNNEGKILFYEWCAYQAALDKKDFSIDKLPFE